MKARKRLQMAEHVLADISATAQCGLDLSHCEISSSSALAEEPDSQSELEAVTLRGHLDAIVQLLELYYSSNGRIDH